MNKSKRLPIATQAGLLKKMFPDAMIRQWRDNALIWEDTIRPSPLSELYTIRLEYRIGALPEVFVISPKPLPLAAKATRLPHVYDHKLQRLCLFYPDGKQWNPSMPLSTTVVLWAYEWLYHYELWLGTNDDWKGGGVHPRIRRIKKRKSKLKSITKKRKI